MLRDTEVLAVGTTGLIPCSLNGVSAMLGMGSLLELQQWSCEPEEKRPGLFPQLFFERLRAQSHDLSSGPSVKRAKMCWKKRELSADGFVVWCSASPQITDAGSPTVKLERTLMQHVCCRETLVYREQSYRVANASVCLLVLKASSCLKWWVLLGKKK